MNKWWIALKAAWYGRKWLGGRKSKKDSGKWVFGKEVLACGHHLDCVARLPIPPGEQTIWVVMDQDDFQNWMAFDGCVVTEMYYAESMMTDQFELRSTRGVPKFCYRNGLLNPDRYIGLYLTKKTLDYITGCLDGTIWKNNEKHHEQVIKIGNSWKGLVKDGWDRDQAVERSMRLLNEIWLPLFAYVRLCRLCLEPGGTTSSPVNVTPIKKHHEFVLSELDRLTGKGVAS